MGKKKNETATGTVLWFDIPDVDDSELSCIKTTVLEVLTQNGLNDISVKIKLIYEEGKKSVLVRGEILIGTNISSKIAEEIDQAIVIALNSMRREVAQEEDAGSVQEWFALLNMPLQDLPVSQTVLDCFTGNEDIFGQVLGELVQKRMRRIKVRKQAVISETALRELNEFLWSKGLRWEMKKEHLGGWNPN